PPPERQATQLRRDPGRDDPRRAHYSARWTPGPPIIRSPLDGRFDWPLGRRHPGGGYNEFQRQDALSRVRSEPARHRAFHAHRPGYTPIPLHGGRSDRIYQTVDRRDRHEQHARPDLRVRLPRGQLFTLIHARGRPGPGESRGRRRSEEKAVTHRIAIFTGAPAIHAAET